MVSLKTRAVLLMSILTLAIGFIIRCNAPETSLNPRQLIVGMSENSLPSMSVGADGLHEGFDVDVIYELARRMDYGVRIRTMELDDLFSSLLEGKLSVVARGLCITPERQELYEMLHYHGGSLTTLPVVFWRTTPDNITSFQDIMSSNISIAVQSGSFFERVLTKMGASNVRSFASNEQLISEIKHGRSDAILVGPGVYSGLRKKHPKLKALQIPVDKAFQDSGLGLALQKGNDELNRKIAAALDSMKRDGFIAERAKKWGVQKIT